MNTSSMDLPLLSNPQASQAFIQPASSRNRSATPGRAGWVVGLGFSLSLTTAASAFLLYLAYKERTFRGNFYDTVVTNRAIVQIFIQLISTLFSLVYTTVLTRLFNAFTVEKLQGRQVSLDCLKWWNSMCHLQLDISLPFRFLWPLSVFIALSILPAAFWTGALTPVATADIINGSFTIPYYGADPGASFWNQSIESGVQPIIRNSSGSFSYSPVRTILGSMLDVASAATAPNNYTQTYKKLDNTGYTYRGRSYGVGASVGLSKAAAKQEKWLKGYEFVESGYVANISCWYNLTMDFTVSLASGGDGQPSWYATTGTLPSGSYESVYLPGEDDSEVVSLLGNPYNGRNVWGIATGQNATRYKPLNMSACEVFFSQRNFSIVVDNEQRFITVFPADGNSTSNYTEVLGPRWSQIKTNVVQQIGMVVQTSGARVFTPLGSALISNIANTKAAQDNGFLPKSLSDSDISLLGISRGLEAMVDAILVAFSSAQYVIAGAANNGTKEVPMKATYAALRIGEPRFIVLIFAINTLIVLLFVVEVVRNQAWKGRTLFDYTDLKSLLVGASRWGIQNRTAVERRLDERGDGWVADPKDKHVGSLEVWLENRAGQMALVINGREGDVELVR